MIGGVQSTLATSVTVTGRPLPSSASSYVTVTASPSTICNTPALSVALSSIEPENWAVDGPVSVSSTTSPAGSESDAMVTSTDSSSSSLVFRPQSLTSIVAVLSQPYLLLFRSTVPASVQCARRM